MAAFGSPVLLKKEFHKLDISSKDFDNMIVKTRPVAREVVAVYTIDEISMELVVKLSANHPLSPVSVECGKRIGVSNALWRQWMLQLTTFLSFQVSTYGHSFKSNDSKIKRNFYPEDNISFSRRLQVSSKNRMSMAVLSLIAY